MALTNYLRTCLFVATSVLATIGVLGANAHVALAQSARTIDVRIDKNGAPPPDEPLAKSLAGVHEGDKVSVRFYPAMVFDLAGIDVPKLDALPDPEHSVTMKIDSSAAFFVYPQDSYLLFAAPKTMMTAQHPGQTHVYVMGSGRYRLHVTRLTESEVNAAVKTDLPNDWFTYISGRTKVCYAADDRGLVGLSDELDASNTAHAANEAEVKRRMAPKPGDARRLYRIPNVKLAADDAAPFALLEAVQLLDGKTVANAKDNGCNDASQAELKNHDATRALLRVVAATLVRVATDGEAPELRYGDNGGIAKVPMKQGEPSLGDWSATTAALAAGKRQMQVCVTIPANAPIRRFVGAVPERCVPTPSPSFAVKAALPNAVRLQPGVIAVNRWRDVRLTGHAVLLVDRAAYFGEKSRLSNLLVGGVLNPAVGLQLGGDNAIVMLMGVSVRLIDEAGLVAGFRFGDQTTTSKFQTARNFYLGFSLDPALFGGLKATK